MTVEIHWASSAEEWSDWTMSGEFDTQTAVLEYKDGKEIHSASNMEGEGDADSEELYSNGTGRFKFKRENNQSSFVWEDDMRGIGKDEVFMRVEPLNPEDLIGRWAEPKGEGSVIDINEDGTIDAYYPDWDNNGELVKFADGSWRIEGQEVCIIIDGDEKYFFFYDENDKGTKTFLSDRDLLTFYTRID